LNKRDFGENMKMKTSKPKLLPAQREELLKALKARFEKHMNRHKGLEWAGVQEKLQANTERLWPLSEMEKTGGEPDVVGQDRKTGEYIFYDCSAESPKGRRSVCYDREALAARKQHKPKDSAVNMAAAMGIELLIEEQYQKTRRRPLLRSPLRAGLRVSQRGGLVLCRQGVPRLATGLNGGFTGLQAS
jgi:hypothetical protein